MLTALPSQVEGQSYYHWYSTCLLERVYRIGLSITVVGIVYNRLIRKLQVIFTRHSLQDSHVLLVPVLSKCIRTADSD